MPVTSCAPSEFPCQLHPDGDLRERHPNRIVLAAKLVRQRIVGIFRPAHPDLVDRQLGKQLLRLEKPGEMVPVLMGCDQQIDMARRSF